MTTTIAKLAALDRLDAALTNYQSAHRELAEAWSNAEHLLGDGIGSRMYPFSNSFDDMGDVHLWIEDFHQELGNHRRLAVTLTSNQKG